jgi:hypothetical protein
MIKHFPNWLNAPQERFHKMQLQHPARAREGWPFLEWLAHSSAAPASKMRASLETPLPARYDRHGYQP